METKLFNDRNSKCAAQQVWRMGIFACMLATSVLLGACGGGRSSGDPQPQETPLGVGPPSLSVDQAAFASTLHKELTQYCGSCHNGTVLGAPAFAHADIETAYTVIESGKVDKLNPARSRIVVKVATEKHGCWSGPDNCINDAAQLQTSIEQWIAQAGGTPVDVAFQAQTIRSLPTSMPPSLLSKRVSGAVALYLFKEGNDTIVHDLSGVAPAMDLKFDAAQMQWVPGQGLKNIGTLGKAEATVASSKKLFDTIAMGSKQYSIEAWIMPTNLTQTGPADIVSYSINTTNANFQLGQTAAQYIYRNRSTATGISTTLGTPNLTTPAASVTTAVQHVVATFGTTVGRKIYLNGVDTGVVDTQGFGDIANWDATYSFLLGNEKTPVANRNWKGVYYLVAIYSQALSATQVKQNYDAGYLDRSILSFDISGKSGIAGSTIELEASELDKASYLFARPTYVGPNPGNLQIKGIQLAMNNRLPTVGQAYRSVDQMVNAPRQEVSSIGTVIAQDKGSSADSFMLTFEVLGGNNNVVPEPAPGALSMETDQRSVIPVSGVRTFDQVNNTMAALTGIPASTASIATEFALLRQSLPGNGNIMSFLPAQQISIAKLATEYCDALVNNATARAAFFNTTPAFEFGLPVATAFNSPLKKDLITNTLINKMIGVNIVNQPTAAESYTEVNSLLNDLVTAASVAVPPLTIDATRTRSIVKGACTAVLSSAALMVH